MSLLYSKELHAPDLPTQKFVPKSTQIRMDRAKITAITAIIAIIAITTTTVAYCKVTATNLAQKSSAQEKS
jgi:hypothetical protein